MAPHAIISPVHSITPSVSESQGVANPFGSVADPHALKGTCYVSGSTIVSQVVYSISSKIFSYETVGTPGLLDSHLQSWSQYYGRYNAFHAVPYLHQLQVRSGASSAVLGYFGKLGTGGKPLSITASTNALVYMQPVLASSSASAVLPLALNVSSIDYDETSNSLFSNYGTALSVARNLHYPVLTPVDSLNGPEIQHLTVLNQFLAALSGRPSINLFDGPEFAKVFTKYTNLLSVDELGTLYQNLLSSKVSQPKDSQEAVEIGLNTLNEILGTNYSLFEYVGHAHPETVFVIYGTHESTQVAQVVNRLSDASQRIGLIQIRCPLPFNANKFVGTIPTSTRKLVVLGQASSNASSVSILKADITAALFLTNRYHTLILNDFAYPNNFNWTPITSIKVLSDFVADLNPSPALISRRSTSQDPITANTSPIGKYLFWGRDNGILLENADKLGLSLSLDDSKYVSVRSKFDNGRDGGLFQTQIVSSEDNVTPVDCADVVFVEDAKILESYDILATTNPGASIILLTKKPIVSSVDQEIVSKLPIQFKRSLAAGASKLIVLDYSIVEDLDKLDDSTKGLTGNFLIQVAFWKIAFPELGGFVVNKLLQANGNGFELLGAVLDKFVNTINEKNALKEIVISPEWIELKDKPESSKESGEVNEVIEETEATEENEELPFFPSETSFFPNPRNFIEENEEATHHGYVELAKKVTFSEAYDMKSVLRPELPVKNFIVKVQENKRLTPNEYNRNIFHIEFDITGTGLTYDIGEALGIHGINSSEAVEKFLTFYGVDGDSLIEVANKESPSLVEIKSARQTLSESVDFLGKPPKRFYESLAPFATNEKEKAALENLASSSGSEELKKRQDVDFCTYVDILEEFPSARPSFAELIKIISPLKRREYSIASSQKLHPNSVHLLVVVVDWVDSKGRTRYGHCSKYLSDLKIGDELVVSVKPSVMKLPPLSTQPIIMSGLGTGLAPFKAFIEEKIWQKQQGMEIGEIFLFLGSRHKKEEYLYGELWEAYKAAGILTHIGAAFSRDQPEKIYIQDKIRESIEDLTDAFVKNEGSFYLCGPTWPVPDITACLEDIVRNGAKKEGKEVKDVAKVVEDMKENGRYILEVY